MADPRERGNSSEQFVNQIPQLVEQGVLGRPDKARRAQRDLINGLIDHSYYDPVLLAFEQLQRHLLEAKDPKTTENAASFLGKLLLDVKSSVVEGGGTKILRITPQVLKTIDRMEEHDGKIQKKPFLQTLLTNNYQYTLTLAAAVKTAHQGQDAMEIHIVTPPQSESERSKREEERDRFNRWVASIRPLTFMTESGMLSSEQRDAFIDTLKAEPAMTVIPRERLYTRKVGGFSLQDIEDLPYPPSAEDTAKITEYLTAMLSEKLSNTDHHLIDEIFFGLTMFYDNEDDRQVIYRNHRLLSIINHWQERFVRQLLSPQDSQTEAGIQKILSGLSQFGKLMVMEGMKQWTAYPLIHDPQHKSVENYDEDLQRHPLAIQAINHYRETHPDTTFLYADEVGLRYFAETILPQFEKRLAHFGVLEKFKDRITVIRRELQARPFSEIHLEALREIFERNCGQEFLDQLNKHAVDIEQVTKDVWQKTFEEGIHFLPMREGINLIEFSENSVPDILGLVSLSINMSGSLPDWQINVAFQLRNTAIRIMGKLDQDGKLVLTAPLAREIPGLYTMLNHIVVLTFHDLVVQEKSERKEKGEVKKQALQSTSTKSPEEQRLSTGRVHSYRGSLPRTQSDTSLISDVYRAVGFKPRRVEIHPAYLKFAKEYEAAVQLYNEALETDAAEQTLEWLRGELEETRKKAYTISGLKQRSIPDRFKLKTVQDPITGEERFLETWVVEHTSPRPTDEELQSPLKLFQRYYRHSSALASLEQMKPWFIGQ